MAKKYAEKAAEDIFGDMDDTFIESVDTGVKNVVIDTSECNRPAITDVGWHDYVMGLFSEDELFEGRPNCAGLRRVAEMVIGQIICSRPTQVFPPSDDKTVGRSTVVWEVTFSNGQVFSDVADCWEGNTDDTFCAFATATAATRAEGRALRKALRIKTVAAEEMTTKNTASVVRQSKTSSSDGEYDESQRMTDPQANFIDVKAKQLNVSVPKMFKEVFSLSTHRKITKQQASAAIEQLNSYQNNGGIPSEILSYEEWR